MEKISIIVPVYNVEQYLHRCLDSLINQTYPNLEILLINDGSTDKSGKICEEYSKKYENIKVIHKDNGGQSSARNVGLNYATGNYIGFVDSDDWVHKEMYEYLYSILKKTDSDVADISGVYAYKEMEIQQSESEIELNIFEGKEVLRNYLYTGLKDSVGQYAVWRKLYKKKLFDNIEFLEGKIYEDILINFQLLSKADKIVRSNKILYFYFQDSGSTTRRGLNQKDFDLIDICEKVVNLSKNETYKDIQYLASVKLARSYFTLLSKMAYFGLSDKSINKKEIIEELTYKLRKNYYILLKSPIPTNRKILITLLCLNYNCLYLPLSVYKKIKHLKN